VISNLEWLTVAECQARFRFQKQGGWLTQEQAARELQVSDTVVKRLIREGILPATHVVECAPWVIERKDLALPAIQGQVKAVKCGRKLPWTAPGQQQFALQ
jgi:hypothetical protein